MHGQAQYRDMETKTHDKFAVNTKRKWKRNQTMNQGISTQTTKKTKARDIQRQTGDLLHTMSTLRQTQQTSTTAKKCKITNQTKQTIHQDKHNRTTKLKRHKPTDGATNTTARNNHKTNTMQQDHKHKSQQRNQKSQTYFTLLSSKYNIHKYITTKIQAYTQNQQIKVGNTKPVLGKANK